MCGAIPAQCGFLTPRRAGFPPRRGNRVWPSILPALQLSSGSVRPPAPQTTVGSLSGPREGGTLSSELVPLCFASGRHLWDGRRAPAPGPRGLTGGSRSESAHTCGQSQGLLGPPGDTPPNGRQELPLLARGRSWASAVSCDPHAPPCREVGPAGLN